MFFVDTHTSALKPATLSGALSAALTLPSKPATNPVAL